MHAWRAVDLRIYLAKKNCGYSISAQSYDFCPRLIQLDIFDFTLSHTLVKTTDSGAYLGSTIGGEYVAKPPLSLRLYNLKTQRFPNILY